MAGVQIGALHVSLSADSAAFDQGMNQAKKTADDAMGSIGDKAKVLGGVLAGLFAIDTIKDRIKEQIDYADSLVDLTARTNQTAEALSAMDYALSFSDATLEDYAAGLQKLSTNMVAASEGSKEQAAIFEALHIKLREQDGQLRNSGTVIMEFADQMASMSNGATKSQIAMDILGKSAGPALLPFLNQGKAGIEEFTEKAKELGLVVSTDFSHASEQINDNLANLSYAATGAWRVLAVQLSPVLTSISENMLKGAQDTRVMESASWALATAIKVVYTGFASGIWAAKTLGDIFGKLSAAAVAAASGELAQASAIMADRTGRDQAKAELLAIGDMWQQAGKKAEESGNLQAEASAKIARTLEIEKALAAEKAARTLAKPKEIKPPKDNFDYGGLKNAQDEYQGITNAENTSNVMYSAKQDLDKAQEDKDWEAMTTDLVDTTYEDTIKKNGLKLDMHKDFISSFLTLDQTRIDGSITNGDAELEAKKKQMSQTVSFFGQGLAQMAQGQGKAAKAAQAIQKAQALYEIGVNTYRAAVGAYAALSPIPFVGPALGVAAAAAAIAFGGSMAQGVLSGGSGGAAAVGGAPAGLPTSSFPTSQAEQRETEKQNQTTYVRIPEDSILTGRKMLDFIDEALGDGKAFTNLRFIPA